MKTFMTFPRPEFFDILGIGTFFFITVVSLRTVLFSRPFPEWAVYCLLVIGVLGLLVDGYIVYKTYFK